ncbi:MAG: hypothetical protein H6843_11695 [Rhodospirillaceae bacterium]|nr:hypothetical protein [Rhodospirillaceae bacterium]
MAKTPLARRLAVDLRSLLRARLGMTSLEYGLIGAFVTSVAVGGVVVVGNRIESALNEAATDARYVGTSRITVSANLDGGGSDTETDAIQLSGGNDTWTGTGANETVSAGAGNDTLDGAGGDDVLDGEEGIDTVSYESAAEGVTVDLGETGAQDTGGAGVDTLANFENLTGSDYDDTLTGNDADNVIDGLGGDDYLDGAAGSDMLLGGDGDDQLVGGAGNDTLDGGTGDDVAFYAGGISDYAFTYDPDTGILTVTDANPANGDEGTDTLTDIEDLEFASGRVSIESIIDSLSPINDPVSYDFSSTADLSNWTNGITWNACAYVPTCNSDYENILGPFDNSPSSTTGTFSLSGNQTTVVVEIDILRGDSWNNDEWFRMTIDGATILNFNQWTYYSRPDYRDGDTVGNVAIEVVSATGPSSQFGHNGVSGFWNDDLVRYRFTITTSSDTLTLGFATNLNDSSDSMPIGEWFGIDNLTITELD